MQSQQKSGDQVSPQGAIDALLVLSETVMRSLEDYKLNLSFLEAELQGLDFKQ